MSSAALPSSIIVDSSPLATWCGGGGGVLASTVIGAGVVAMPPCKLGPTDDVSLAMAGSGLKLEGSSEWVE